MKFWDASAIVPLLVEEKHSRACRDLGRADPGVVVWQFTFAEVVGAITRLTRQVPPLLSGAQVQTALHRLRVLSKHWKVVRTHDEASADGLNERATDLMLKHPLQSGDALQLAAAMRFFEPIYRRGFVAVDRGLAHAAKAEGFTIYPERARRKK